jgi:hypothetical protein
VESVTVVTLPAIDVSGLLSNTLLQKV